MRVRWTTPAANDIEAIGDYLYAENPTAAVKIVQKILATEGFLADHPYAGKPGRVAGTREWVIPSTAYLLPYRIVADEIQILRVYHGAGQWPKTL